VAIAQSWKHEARRRELRDARRASELDEAHQAAETARAHAAKAKTADAHRAAAQALRRAAQVAQANGKDSEAKGYEYLAGTHDRAADDADRRAVKSAKTAEVAKGAAGSRFAKSTPDEIDAHMRERYGLGFSNGSGAAKAYKALKAEHSKGYWDRTREQNDANEAKLRELFQQSMAGHGFAVRGHTEADITENSAAAKGQRVIAGHVDAALADLEARGYDIKGSLSKGKVSLAAGSVGKAYGLAWQKRDGVGYFAVSHDKVLKKQDEYERAVEARKARGLPKWTVGHDARSTIVHELAHAIGLQPHIDSPRKLGELMMRMFPDAKQRRDWIKSNLSEYATTNIKETDAELCTLVTSPDYQAGTLPRELEDHVHRLFLKKA
jgi:hypothetical protein